MISIKQTNPYDDDSTDYSKESSSLLGNSNGSSGNNVYQAKQNMAAKKKIDYKNENISSADVEKNKSFF